MQIWKSNQVNGATRALDHGVPIPRDALVKHIREERELSEADAMACAPEQPVTRRRKPHLREWGDQEIGKAVRLASEGKTPAEIAWEIGEPCSGQAVGEMLSYCEHGLLVRLRGKSAPRKPRRSADDNPRG